MCVCHPENAVRQTDSVYYYTRGCVRVCVCVARLNNLDLSASSLLNMYIHMYIHMYVVYACVGMHWYFNFWRLVKPQQQQKLTKQTSTAYAKKKLVQQRPACKNTSKTT